MYRRTLTAILLLILASVISIACIDFVLRTTLQWGLLWSSTTLRHLTLILAFVGAAVATDRRQHLAIDLLSDKLPSSVKPHLSRLLDVLVAGLSLSLTVGAFLSMRSAFEQWSSNALDMEVAWFPALISDWRQGRLPQWCTLLIVSGGFLLLALHFLAGARRAEADGSSSEATAPPTNRKADVSLEVTP